MIFERKENLEKYKIDFLGPVIEYLKSNNLKNAPCGLVEINGKKLTVNVVDRVLEKEPETWEVHKKYIDVHVMLSGKERICFSDESELSMTREYQAEGDAALYSGKPDNMISYELQEGDVMIFLPGEIHLTNGPCNLESAKKAIFKVLFEN